MTSWQPHIDLVRLLEALGEEIVAATEREIHQACAEDGHSVLATADETRRVIGAAGDLDDPDASIALVEPIMRRELAPRQH
jgi:hypothetical protein